MKGAASDASRDPFRTGLHADPNSSTRGRLTADPRKPGEILNGWQSRLDALALSEPDVAATFLQKVACGLAHPVGAPIAQAVFNDLLLHEAYGLLADAFAAYNYNGTSPSSLKLRLPRDRVGTAPAARDEAFGRMRVQKLELVALPDSADKDPRQQPPLIAAAACECAAVLLRSDATTELVVHGALASTETMSRACAGSSWAIGCGRL